MALGRTYRFVVLNSLGQTIAIAGIAIKGRRWNFSTTGQQTWEGSEASIDSSSGTTTNGSYFAGSTNDNSTAGYLGGTFKFTIVAPASSNGTVTVFLQRSTDGGSSWPDNGNGQVVKVFGITTSGTYTDTIEI
jgi:hypothetical protein